MWRDEFITQLQIGIRQFLRPYWIGLQAGIALYGILVNGFLLARITVGERSPAVGLANNFVPWWALGGLVLAGIALFSRRRWVLIALQVPILITFALLYGDRFGPRDTSAAPENGFPLTVATFNIYAKESNPARIVETIRALDADIIGLQELGPEHTLAIERALMDDYPYQVLYPSWSLHGTGLLSRYPVIETDVYLRYWKYVRHQRIVLDVNGTRVTVYVTHTHSPRSNKPWNYDVALRTEQIATLRRTIAEQARKQAGPVLVLCDCNMSDQSDDYRVLDGALDGTLEDAFRVAGRSLGFTFPARANRWFPLIVRLDYVWFSDHFVAQHARVGNFSGGSDHRPVIAELVLREDNP
ncbi:MAG: endonuclease/exonuclease/phosphatase family protein [Anaerolineae bacterium]|nr:endonuclease/exonuclease/phosphatase family protein [Anaerolineae bacterium]